MSPDAPSAGATATAAAPASLEEQTTQPAPGTEEPSTPAPSEEQLRALQGWKDKAVAEEAGKRTDIIEQRANALAEQRFQQYVQEQQPQIQAQAEERTLARQLLGAWDGADSEQRGEWVRQNPAVVEELATARRVLAESQPNPYADAGRKVAQDVLKGVQQMPGWQTLPEPDRARILQEAKTPDQLLVALVQLEIRGGIEEFKRTELPKLVQQGVQDKLAELRPGEGQPNTTPGGSPAGSSYDERIDRIASGKGTKDDEDWYYTEGPGRHLRSRRN